MSLPAHIVDAAVKAHREKAAAVAAACQPTTMTVIYRGERSHIPFGLAAREQFLQGIFNTVAAGRDMKLADHSMNIPNICNLVLEVVVPKYMRTVMAERFEKFDMKLMSARKI